MLQAPTYLPTVTWHLTLKTLHSQYLISYVITYPIQILRTTCGKMLKQHGSTLEGIYKRGKRRMVDMAMFKMCALEASYPYTTVCMLQIVCIYCSTILYCFVVQL